MKVTGIIAEYNPFHTGHQYQFSYIRQHLKTDYIVIAMSGDFVQRGTPSVFSKYLRAEMALRCGADLVLELPVSVSTASAEAFAFGGVSLLNSLGVVDELCFGSECGNVSALMELARILTEEPAVYRQLLKKFLNKGHSFPVARNLAISEYLNDPVDILKSPNNILGIEYCKALLRLHSNIRPAALTRNGMGYHQITSSASDFPSATAVRSLLAKEVSTHTISQLKSWVPEEIFTTIQTAWNHRDFFTDSMLDPVLVYRLLEEDFSGLLSFPDISESLAKRIINHQNELRGFSQAVSSLKTKEMTQTRIQRALLHIILKTRSTPAAVPYGRILGFRKESSPLLKAIKKSTKIPLISKLADADKILDQNSLSALSETTFASNLYQKLLALKTQEDFIHEYQQKIIIL